MRIQWVIQLLSIWNTNGLFLKNGPKISNQIELCSNIKHTLNNCTNAQWNMNVHPYYCIFQVHWQRQKLHLTLVSEQTHHIILYSVLLSGNLMAAYYFHICTSKLWAHGVAENSRQCLNVCACVSLVSFLVLGGHHVDEVFLMGVWAWCQIDGRTTGYQADYCRYGIALPRRPLAHMYIYV